MAFDSLTEKLQNVFKNLRSKGRLTEDDVKEAMKELLYIPFEFEDGGTRVIHYSPENYEPQN
mgnify:FL=1